MDDKMRKKIKFTAIAVPALAAGTVAIAAAYQSGTKYQPSQSDQKIQANQVVFKDDENTLNQKSDKKKDESELWKEEQNSEDESLSGGDHADYMFQSDWATQGSSSQLETTNVNTNGGDINVNLSQSANTSRSDDGYDLVSDGSDADITIKNNNNSNSAGGLLPSENNSGAGTNNGNDNNGNGGNGTNGDGTGGNNSNLTPIRPTPTPDPTPIRPEPDPSEPSEPDTPGTTESVKDPEIEKTNPYDPLLPQKPYEDGVKPKPGTESDTEKDPYVVIQKPTYMDDNILFYKGQTLTKQEIFNGLETYVITEDNTYYMWGADAYNKYIRIDAVSFDGGNTWISSSTVTIPKDIPDSKMLIKTSYRLSVNDKQWSEKIVSYEVEDSGIFLLSRKIKKGETSIDKTTILNSGKQYLEDGSTLNLLYYQSAQLDEENLSTLFPGWMENGKIVPWFYTVTPGRHILEPAAAVPLSDDYTVKVIYQWMSDDMQVGFQYDNLCYLQTLTNFKDDAAVVRKKKNQDNTYRELDVPEYVQAVIIDSDADLEVSYLNLPDTVIYIDNENSGLRVTNGYKVDKDNLVYAANSDGVLTNKSGTELLEIPHNVKEITVNDQVEKVNIDFDNQISEIRLEADSMDQLPEIKYENLNHCKIVVDESMLDEYIESMYKRLQSGEENCTASKQNPDITYTVVSHAIISNQGKLYKVLDSNTTSLTLPGSVKTIQEDAFANASHVKTIIMPKDGSEVTLEENCFAGSNLKTIQCYNEKQVQSLKEQIERSGAQEDLKIELIQVSKEGFHYGVEQNGDQETATIISAPDGIEEFDGTLTAKDGTELTVTGIGAAAFAECKDLVWVELPESVKEIGYQAFKNCSALQGLMITSEDEVTIEDGILDGCCALRFAASNAIVGNVQDEYDFRNNAGCNVQTMFFVPTAFEGYQGYFVHFTEQSGVTKYQMVDLGENAKALYGLNEAGDTWMLIRTGSEMPEYVELPEKTKEIFNYACAQTTSQTGEYQLNWNELSNLMYLDEGAFSQSALSGDITLGEDCGYLDTYAFYSCENIANITVTNTNASVHEFVFYGDSNLKTVEFKGIAQSTTFSAGNFTGCNNLTDLIFDDTEAPSLMHYGSYHFYFNQDWEESGAPENFRVHVPAGSEMNYIKKWRYAFLEESASIATDTTTAYQEAWKKKQEAMQDWDNWIFPTDEEVDEALVQELCDAENKIRTYLKIDQVSEPSEFYPYRVNDDGYITLIGAPSYITDVSLTGDTLELLDGWSLDYIGTGAFSKSSRLRDVWIPETMVGIQQNAFTGVESSELNLYFEGSSAPELIREDTSSAFEFGVDEDKIRIYVPSGCEETYIEAWKYALAGYANLDEMNAAVRAEMEAEGKTPTDEEVEAETQLRLVQVENRIRKMMGMELLEEPVQEQSLLSEEGQLSEDSQPQEQSAVENAGKTEVETEDTMNDSDTENSIGNTTEKQTPEKTESENPAENQSDRQEYAEETEHAEEATEITDADSQNVDLQNEDESGKIIRDTAGREETKE